MRRLMRDEWQFGLGQISSLQRHPKPEFSAGPPHPTTTRTEMDASTVYAEIASARNEWELNAALEKLRLLPEAGRESFAELVDQRMVEFSERNV